MSRSGEFELIRRFLAPLATAAGAGRLEDDAAFLDTPDDGRLVVTTDTMVEGVHFPGDGPPGLIARRLLRCNLSDLAAMGARPEGYLLNLALPAASTTRGWKHSRPASPRTSRHSPSPCWAATRWRRRARSR